MIEPLYNAADIEGKIGARLGYLYTYKDVLYYMTNLSDEYEAELATLRAELEAARAMEPVPDGEYDVEGGATSIRVDGKCLIVYFDLPPHLYLARVTLPDDMQLMRRTQQTEVSDGTLQNS